MLEPVTLRRAARSVWLRLRKGGGIAHVRTQMPYALLVGGLAIACGTLPAGVGMPWWLGLVFGTAAMWAALRIVGRDG